MKKVIKKISAVAMALSLLGAGSTIVTNNDNSNVVHAAHSHCCCSGTHTNNYKETKVFNSRGQVISWTASYDVYSNCCGHKINTVKVRII